MRGLILTILGLASTLAGCATQAPVIREPVVVERFVYVGIPPALTRKCPVAKPRDNSGKELLRVARERRKCIETMHGQLDAIGRIQGTIP